MKIERYEKLFEEDRYDKWRRHYDKKAFFSSEMQFSDGSNSYTHILFWYYSPEGHSQGTFYEGFKVKEFIRADWNNHPHSIKDTIQVQDTYMNSDGEIYKMSLPEDSYNSKVIDKVFKKNFIGFLDEIAKEFGERDFKSTLISWFKRGIYKNRPVKITFKYL